MIKKNIITVTHISPIFLFLLPRTKEQIYRWLKVPFIYDFNYYKKFKLKKSKK